MKEPVAKAIHVLMVEDDPDDVELLESAFKDRDIASSFTVISQGDKVLSYLGAGNPLPDIVLLDLNLPKVHGKEILTHIKASPTYSHLPIIILTTSSAPADVEFCLKAGAAHYFTKPTKLAEFDRIVDTVVAAALQ